MISITVPGYRQFSIENVVLDYNGTLACDGELLEGISTQLNKVSEYLKLHIITADTFGKAKSALEGIRCELSILGDVSQAEVKQKYIASLGSDRTLAIGNGRNDRLMLKEAALGIAVLGREGIAVESILGADVVCSSIVDALELLLNTKRLIATLRS